jgi:NitT/TauT family transport system permease protein
MSDIWRKGLRAAANLWGIALLLVAWEIAVAVSGINAIVVPAPASVASALLSAPRLYILNGMQTLMLALVGLAGGMLVGTVIALAAWNSRLLQAMLTPPCMLVSSIPVVALIPVLARLFGYGEGTVLAIVIVISFFPAFVFTTAGLKSLPPGSDDLFRVLGANRWTRLRYLVLPCAVPSWMTALRLSAPSAILSAMIAEFLMGSSGLGYLFRTATARFDMDQAFATSGVAVAVSTAGFIAASWAENRVVRAWR